MSCKPCHFSGNGRSDFASNSSSCTFNVGSPVLVVKQVPSTPMKSPRSSNLKTSIASGPSSFACKKICIRPLASLRSTKWLLPMSRCALMRPATRKLAPSANFSRTCAISPEVSKATPKGATPSFSKAANFSRRNASNSLPDCSIPASDSKQNQSNEQIEWGSASILPDGLASKETDIYRDKFGWKGKKDGEIFVAPEFFP